MFLRANQSFETRWQFKHCVGAVDGKHIAIRPPTDTGTLFYNYKGGYSIVLMAVADSRYRFIYFDVGANGSASDSGIWNRCSLKKAIEEQRVRFPAAKPLQEGNADSTAPFVFVGDDAFPLGQHMMKPFRFRDVSQSESERIFSYRLSRARRVVENAFGIMTSRFRVLLSPIALRDTENIKKVVLACLALHNMLIEEYSQEYASSQLLDAENTAEGTVREGGWRSAGALPSVASATAGGRHSARAKDVRERFVRYFQTPEGAVPWQRRMAGLE